MYENRKYVIFNVSELSSIDFDQVLETSVETVRKSVDNTLTFVKYDGTIPTSVNNLSTKQGPYTHTEMLNILSTDIWTDNSNQIV